ncbi:MAG: twin-arginine translocase TatA/TatE family subunit [Gammaproteobacteria bacterium]|nr:twin-arginine translocase TatA/TatE family subunit [Gammaproteobacteria bacterium]MYK46872.1 twin-arginine translocase TatA/TatE family subunit [Gammaproteobacteria bacterium]
MFGPKELVVVLVVLLIVLVVFGPKRIKSLGSELGNAIKGFRKAVREGDGADAKTLEHEGQEASASPGATRTE